MITNTVLRKLATAFFLLVVTVGIGVVGFQFWEGYNLLDAFYMTVITMSTVGYAIEGTGELTDGGKLFVILLIVSTIGTFLYVINTITTLVVEGEIRSIFKVYRVNQEISKLKDHIVVCGLGRNGRQAVEELRQEGVSFLVIENDEAVISRYLELHPKDLILQGDATEEELLRQARVEVARGVITALASDAANVFVTLTIRQLNPTVPVASRASNESSISKLKIAGATSVILPNILGGRKMARVITKPALVDFIDLITGQGKFPMSLDQVDCGHGSPMVGKSLRELDIRSRTGALVLGTQHPNGQFELNPNVNMVIQEGEKLFVIGTEEQLDAFRKEFT